MSIENRRWYLRLAIAALVDELPPSRGVAAEPIEAIQVSFRDDRLHTPLRRKSVVLGPEAGPE